MWKGWGGGKLAGVSSLFPQLGWALNSGHQAWRQAPLLPAEPSCCPHLPGSKGVSARLLCFSMPEDLAESQTHPPHVKATEARSCLGLGGEERVTALLAAADVLEKSWGPLLCSSCGFQGGSVGTRGCLAARVGETLELFMS